MSETAQPDVPIQMQRVDALLSADSGRVQTLQSEDYDQRPAGQR